MPAISDWRGWRAELRRSPAVCVVRLPATTQGGENEIHNKEDQYA